MGGREGGCTVLRRPRPRGGLCSVAAGACERRGMGRRSKNRARGHWARAAPRWNRARITGSAVCRVAGRGQGGKLCHSPLGVGWCLVGVPVLKLAIFTLTPRLFAGRTWACSTLVHRASAVVVCAVAFGGTSRRPADLLEETSPIRVSGARRPDQRNARGGPPPAGQSPVCRSISQPAVGLASLRGPHPRRRVRMHGMHLVRRDITRGRRQLEHDGSRAERGRMYHGPSSWDDGSRTGAILATPRATLARGAALQIEAVEATRTSEGWGDK